MSASGIAVLERGLKIEREGGSEYSQGMMERTPSTSRADISGDWREEESL